MTEAYELFSMNFVTSANSDLIHNLFFIWHIFICRLKGPPLPSRGLAWSRSRILLKRGVWIFGPGILRVRFVGNPSWNLTTLNAPTPILVHFLHTFKKFKIENLQCFKSTYRDTSRNHSLLFLRMVESPQIAEQSHRCNKLNLMTCSMRGKSTKVSYNRSNKGWKISSFSLAIWI